MKTRFTILGSGSSLGIPRIDGYFGKCNPKIKQNFRSRCSALVTHDKFNILIDTSPDLKTQLLKNKIKNIDKVFYTHLHGDQTHGINELRVFFLKNRKKLCGEPHLKYVGFHKKNKNAILISLSSFDLWLCGLNRLVFYYSFAALLPLASMERFGVSASNIVSSYWGARGTSGNMSRPILLK